MADNDLGSIKMQLNGVVTDLGELKSDMKEMRMAYVQMARVEEKNAQALQNIAVLFKEMTEIQKRLNVVEKENATQGQSLGLFERLGWTVVSLFGTVAGGIAVWWLK